MSSPSPVIVAATVKHTATVIFLHGLGDTGHGWAGAMASVKMPHMKVICPTASVMPVSLNNGFPMPSWFDIRGLDISAAVDTDGINKATALVHGLIDEEVAHGVPSDRIVLGGFSQGGALAINAALTYTRRLAAVVALSCWMPLSKNFDPSSVVVNKDIPILQCHGDCDPIVSYSFGQLTASVLKKVSKNVEFKTYAGLMHSSSDPELDDVKQFLQKYIPPL